MSDTRKAVTRGFENLRVYQLAEEIADAIWPIVRNWDQFVRNWDQFAKDTVGKQLVRSIDSVGANIAEGAGRGSYQGQSSLHQNCQRLTL
jgi:four helix bundle protein